MLFPPVVHQVSAQIVAHAQAYGWLIAAAAVGMFILMGFLRWLVPHLRHPTNTRGSAIWATRRMIRQAGLFHGQGLLIGEIGYGWLRQYLRVDHERHVLLTGPTRVGKTMKMTVKMIVTDDEEAMVILDLKNGELERLTRRYREQLGPVYTFAPASRTSDRLNLLDLVRWGTPFEVADAQRLAGHLSQGDQESVEQRPLSDEGQYYRRWARVLLWGVAIYLHYDETHQWPCSLPGMLHYFTQAGDSVKKSLQRLAEAGHPIVQEVAGLVLSRTAKDQQEVFSAAAGWLMPWFDPLLAHHMGSTTIPLEQLQHSDRPMTIYLRASPDDVQAGGRLRPVFRAIIDQCLVLSAERPVRDYTRRVRGVFEDFSELGYFRPLETITAFYGEAGWGLWLVAQSVNQLWRHYGRHTALFDNCDTWICFQPNQPETAEYLAKKLGERTVTEMMEGRSRQPFSLFRSRFMREQAVERSLLDAWEVMHLGKQHALVFVGGTDQPLTIKARARPYWKDRTLRGRVG